MLLMTINPPAAFMPPARGVRLAMDSGASPILHPVVTAGVDLENPAVKQRVGRARQLSLDRLKHVIPSQFEAISQLRRASLTMGAESPASKEPVDVPVAKPSDTEKPPIVVVGGGIVGLTTAYYLTRQGHRVTILEKCAIACHSSGKAGGFLTDGGSGWHNSGAMDQLAKHSFALHEELANDLGAENLGFRRVRCVGRSQSGGRLDTTPEWLADGFETDMGNQDSLAQVTPYKFMDTLHASVISQGAEVVIAKVTGVEMKNGTVSAVKVESDGEQRTIPCSALVLAMGPWARDAAAWFPESYLPTNTVFKRYTSVIWDDTRVGEDATMVFVSGKHQVEIYARSNEAYANGCPTIADLPDNPLEIVPPPETIDNIISETAGAVGRLKDAEVIRATACFLPGSDDGNPVVGRVPKTNNAVISCAGGCWGILNGPAMGQAAADLVMGNEPAVDLSAFDPKRFDMSGMAETLREMGVSSRLVGLVAANPHLLNVLKQDPKVADQLLAYVEGSG